MLNRHSLVQVEIVVSSCFFSNICIEVFEYFFLICRRKIEHFRRVTSQQRRSTLNTTERFYCSFYDSTLWSTSQTIVPTETSSFSAKKAPERFPTLRIASRNGEVTSRRNNLTNLCSDLREIDIVACISFNLYQRTEKTWKQASLWQS